jgi:hypothetical protein
MKFSAHSSKDLTSKKYIFPIATMNSDERDTLENASENSNERGAPDIFIKAAVNCAEDVLKIVWEAKKLDSYKTWNDDEKIAHITKNKACDVFYMRFPVVARCMICLDLYNKRAFERFLELYCAAGYPSEEQWLSLQAKYVMFMWEERQWDAKRSIKNHDRRKVYSDALTMLKSETENFKMNYDKTKKELDATKEKAREQRAIELIKRLQSGEQKLSDDAAKRLFDAVLDAKLRQEQSN